MRLVRSKANSVNGRRVRRGFTLVELIVVLTILAILAAIGIASAVNYIDRSKFEQNEQNAITIYQTAQTAVSQKINNGSIDQWAHEVLTITHASIDTSRLTVVNESAHKTVSLTYNPNHASGEEDSKLYDLLRSYFYDGTIFAGTISVEFDIRATLDDNGIYHYSASVVSAFYSKENDAAERWDSDCIGSSTDGLPDRDGGYRRTTSHVGYFNGTESSALGTNGNGVPGSVLFPIEEEIVDPVDYVFTFRNAETLDITWSIFDDPSHTASFIITFEKEDGSKVYLKINEANLFYNIRNNSTGTVTYNNSLIPTDNGSYLTESSTIYEFVTKGRTPLTIERRTFEGLAQVGVSFDGENYTNYIFPITVSAVTGDAQASYPEEIVQRGYTAYSLSLDCMMTRSECDSRTEDNEKNQLFSTRLFGDTPHVICATLDSGSYGDDGIAITSSFARRAINDSIYATGWEVIDIDGASHIYFDYNSGAAVAANDVDNKCYVNTMFGDLKAYTTYGDSTSTLCTSAGNAVITSYRHLSNIRRTSDETCFWIGRDLWWYVREDNLQASEVRSYVTPSSSINYRFHSPVENGTLKVVSFPALPSLASGQQLSALSKGPDAGFYTINNVQLRRESFNPSEDTGYGLICEVKSGATVGSIYTNNLNMVLFSVTDGTESDYYRIEGRSSRTQTSVGSTAVNVADTRTLDGAVSSTKPIGGLVALNNGTVGVVGGSIRMSNTVVFAGEYWKLGKYQESTGGVIGTTNGSMNGAVELCGSFAIIGRDRVGGIIGRASADINARLIVNGGISGSSEFVLPCETHNGTTPVSCIVSGKNAVGGAIGWVDGVQFTYSSSSLGHTLDAATGISFTGVGDDDYDIDVNLSENSLVLHLISFKITKEAEYGSGAVGGAIGCMRNSGGDHMYVRVNNSGTIMADACRTDTQYQIGGAVGYEFNCTTTNIYVNVTNSATSRIGYFGSVATSFSAGGAYGQFDNKVCPTGRTIAINVVNYGTIQARGGSEGYGVGGAIGGARKYSTFIFVINVRNEQGSSIIDNVENAVSTLDGAGGAIGSINHDSSECKAGTEIYVINAGSIHGYYNVGGAIGMSDSNSGVVYAINNGITISGIDFVGGAVGRNYCSQRGNIQAVLNDSHIVGRNFVGGAAGALQKYFNSASVTAIVCNGSSTVGDIAGDNTVGGSLVGGVVGDLRVINNDNSGIITLSGDGNDTTTLSVVGGSDSTGVGGAIGMMRTKDGDVISRISMPTQQSGNRLIVNVDGFNNVGGAIGLLQSCGKEYDTNVNTLTGSVQDYSMIVELNVVLRAESHITGINGANVGGAIGYVRANKGSTFQRGISVTVVSGSANSQSGISGSNCVGGAVGKFDNTYPTQNNGSEIVVDLRAVNYPITASIESGDANLGGAIGYLAGTTTKTYSAPPITVYLGTSSVISEYGNNVGGAIGKAEICNGTNILLNNTLTVFSSGTLQGLNRVGGIIGYNRSYLNTVSSEFISGGKVIGADCVGGAVGLTERSISIVAVTICNDGAINGVSHLGGAIGSVGTSTDTTSIEIGTVGVAVNEASNPIVQNATVANTVDAYIGGAIGQVYRGTIKNVNLSGTGGTVSIDSAVMPGYPVSTISGAMMITGTGCSMGGVIGQVGSASAGSAKVYNISVDTLGLCVVSKNSSQRIGGWIGICTGQLGESRTLTSYSVDTVKVVYSAAENIGGFCGTINSAGGATSMNTHVYAIITVNLNGATITGRARVGGAIGDLNYAEIDGDINVNITGGTRIGDYAGNISVTPVNLSNCICVDVGGALGRFANGSKLSNNGRIRVRINDTSSLIFAGSTNADGLEVDINNAGVGGAIGRYGTTTDYGPTLGVRETNEAYLSVLCSSQYVSVYSAASNLGGAIGHMYGGTIGSGFSTPVIRGDGAGSVGGFIGRMDAGTINNSYCGGHTVGGQYIPFFENITGVENVGGFIGYIGESVSLIHQCYSTASVRGTNYVGGFAGRIDCSKAKFLESNYCTGLVQGYNINVNSDGISEVQGYFGKYAGYIPNTSIFLSYDPSKRDNLKNTNKVVEEINIELNRVGNLPESDFNNGIICLAKWRGAGPDYIRVNPASNYYAYPFDSTLGEQGTTDFPLRTFISYPIPNDPNRGYTGTHYGDWPEIPNSNVILPSHVTLASYSYPYDGPDTRIPIDDIIIEKDGHRLQYSTDLAVTDFTVDYRSNDGIGTAYLFIAGRNNYWGTVTVPFEITRRDITGAIGDGTLVISGLTTDEATAEYPYTGEPIHPVTLVFHGETLVEGRDYDITYSDDTNVGEVTVTITGNGNFEGTYVGVFKITAINIDEAVQDGRVSINVASVEYDGTALEPEVTVSFNGTALVVGQDYTVIGYENNVDASEEAKVHIEGAGNFSGTTTVVFTIAHADISSATLTVDPREYIYAGSDIIPTTITLALTSEGDPLTIDVDYTLSYEGNDAVGTATVTATGAGNYTGTVSAEFTIRNPEVTFDSAGGSEVASQSVPYGETVPKPDDPTLEGYMFLGWFASSEATDPFDFSTQIDSDVTLTARWQIISCTVIFVSNGGSSVDDQPVDYGSYVTRPEDPTRDGFTFLGWFDSDDASVTTPFDFENTPITSALLDADNNFRLYARWELTQDTGD